MNHNWVEKDFNIKEIKKSQCSLCGTDSYIGIYKHNTIRYIWTRPMGAIQPECPETCEETLKLIGEEK